MREILFRGKDVKGNWHTGLLAHIGNAWYISNKAGIATAYEVITETVGQFTGLLDKNGKKIFEGDILKYEEEYYLVKFLEYRWAAIYKTCLPDDLDQRTAKDFEKVGNIYDNPELLEG